MRIGTRQIAHALIGVWPRVESCAPTDGRVVDSEIRTGFDSDMICRMQGVGYSLSIKRKAKLHRNCVYDTNSDFKIAVQRKYKYRGE